MTDNDSSAPGRADTLPPQDPPSANPSSASPSSDGPSSQSPPPPPPPPSAPGGSDRWGSLVDMRRSSSDRYLGGVLGGAGRHLDIDPLLLRVAMVVFTIVGGGGLILYAAAWILLPTDTADRSPAARWFGLREREPAVRTIGLIAAAALALLSVFDLGGWGGGGPGAWGVFWMLVLIGGAYYLLGVLPQRRRERRGGYPRDGWSPQYTEPSQFSEPSEPSQFNEDHGTPDPDLDPGATAVQAKSADPTPRRRSGTPALLALTFGMMALVLGSIAIVDLQSGIDIAASTYVVAAIAVCGLGMLLSAWWGTGWWLVPIIAVLGVVLAVAAVVPTPTIADRVSVPTDASQVASTYEVGIGRQELDLSNVDPDDLAGRSVTMHVGVGALRVIVPEDLPVRVITRVDAGDRTIFGQASSNGGQVLTYADDDPDQLTLDLRVGLGDLEVTRS